MEKNFDRRVRAWLWLLTLLAGVCPFALYTLARATGRLPDESGWSQGGGNHGPWFDTWQGFTIGLPLLGLVLATFVSMCFYAWKDLATLWRWLSLVAAQLALVIFQLVHLFWLID